ncbi:Trk system potassium transporter TrkA [Desulfotalea psychrophila]|uniref:Trk system potassium uptake protein TrkA n=1 Tax=Desulfotalea psychrophila (strain LSv54 / DSM 12343) TaxID=177439 RepID=Q6AQC0_DESPS|nr:Trk system potassium transporter TrkA [Desulfotalea psychrophila]CAG35453.1 probable Trk system potassium uptake protein (TrkA) [Desulfotalea psychrophila LSv54]
MFFKKGSPTEKILLLGLGGVGFYLAKRLVDEEYAVTIIEQDSKMIAMASQQIDARFIKGDAMSMGCWREAGAGSMDYLIAVTDNDAVNMMASLIANKFGIRQKIARIRSLEFGNPDSIITAKDLKLDLSIYPEELTAQEIVRLVERNSGHEIIEIADGEIELWATEVNDLSPWVYKQLKEVAQIHSDFYFRVVAIARGIATIIPSGEDELQPDDHLFIMVHKNNLPKLMKLMGNKKNKQHKVLILGGGRVGTRVASLLEKSVQVTLVEKNEARAEELSLSLPNTEILNGDGSDGEVLITAGLFSSNTLISLTGENETNIMTSLLAKHLIKQKKDQTQVADTRTIAIVNKEDYLVLAATTCTDIALNKKIMAANEILKYIRKREFQAVVHLHGFDAEVVELIAAPKSIITKKPLAKLDPYYLKKMIVGAVYHDNGWDIGIGDTQIEAKQRVLIICASKDLKIVRKVFSA